MARKSAAMKHLQEIAKLPMESEYTFIAPSGTGKKMEHRIRVELSRARAALVQSGRVPKAFKLIFEKIETMTDGNEQVTLKKTQVRGDVTEEVLQLFGDLSAGEKVGV